MALSWDTLRAIPRLNTYADARAHYENVTPIRRDPNNVRPCGRRDQKWFNIWEGDNKSICIGYGYTPESRKVLVEYEPGGTIILHRYNRFSYTSDNERLSKLLGMAVRTYQYDQWVHCLWYDKGEKRCGWLPTPVDPKADWGNTTPTLVRFVREGVSGSLVYLNYQYPVIHKMDKQGHKEAFAPYARALGYLDNLRKLQGQESGNLQFTEETKAEYFGWSQHKNYQGQPVANPSPVSITTYISNNSREDVDTVLKWLSSEHIDDWMRAGISLCRWRHDDGLGTAKALIRYVHRDKVFTTHEHTEGRLVRDKYRNMFF